jgi:hypothetical protein
LDFLLNNTIPKEKFYISKDIGQDAIAASKLTSIRLGYWVPDLDSQLLRDKYDSQLSIYTRFMSLAVYLEELRDSFNSTNNKLLKMWKREGAMDTFEPANPYSKKKHFKYYQVGNIVLLKAKISRKADELKYKSFVITNTHYSRIIEYLKSSAILSIFLPEIEGIDHSESTLLDLLRYQSKVAINTPNGVGSVFKTARQILFLRGDESRIMGSFAQSLFIAGLTGVKLKYGEDTADFLYQLTGDRKSSLNLANIFRIVPHPDAEMEEVFESIRGFTEPNTVDEKFFPRFIGNVRKVVYQSLISQRFDVRATADDPTEQVVQSFVDKINSTSTPISSIMEYGFAQWSSIEFEVVRGLFDSEEQDIPVSNKSSAPNSKITTDEIKSLPQIKKLSEYKTIKKKLGAINDVVTVLSGSDELAFKPARARFRSVIAAHKKFEADYLDEGVTIDSIPSEDLAKFVVENKDASYTVLTEPKLGEVHKEVTRLFYMAEQALKIMTQVTERAIKKVISKAAGVSIVKSYRARRKEIEEMLDAYTGLMFTDDGEDELGVIYVSFDMSEFSKKFPQALVRAIGKVLGELTGEDWMDRIDLFFRASIVYHNTRGFTGVQSGAKGGFEGFLNFIWTLAMKVVMDIATESSGVEGVLAVYSDDGLLRLYVSGDKAIVADKIRVVKKVFAAYGLIFHLDKTAVSREILEYLGLYGEKGMLIPTWIKEVMSIGKRKQTPGLETVYDKITLWDSQCNAVVKANGPSYPCMLVKTILSMQSLRRLNRTASPDLLALLTIIPSSAGGFRISSISESSLLSSIEGFSEFSADLELLSKVNPVACNAIGERIYKNLKREKDAEPTILTGSFLQTTLPDTSGLGLAISLVEEAGQGSNLAMNPLTDSITKQILDGLKGADNVSQRLVRELVTSVPAMIKYTKSLALVKSSAALKFVTRQSIISAQIKDTKRCMNSIETWITFISEFDGRSGRFCSVHFMRMIKDKLYPSYKFCKFKESPRVALIPCLDGADIIATFETTEKGKITNQTYIEPKYKGLGAQLTTEVQAETSFNTEQRMNERFINDAARIVATNVSLLSLYYIIASAFSIPCPTLPTETVIKSHKSAKNFGMGGVHTMLPVPFHALVTSRMGVNMFNYLRNRDKTDRTTYVEASRITGYLRASITIKKKITLDLFAESYKYKLRSLEDNTSNPDFQSPAYPPNNLISNKVTKTFHDLIIEENSQANMLESVISTNGLITCVKSTPIAKAILLSKLTKWLRSVISGNHTVRAIPFSIPDPWKRELLIEASISVAFDESEANIRRAIQLSMDDFITETAYQSSSIILKSDNARYSLNTCLNNRQEAFDNFDLKFREIIASVSNLGLDERMRDQLVGLRLHDTIVLIKFVSFLKRKSVTGDDTTPTVVINTSTFADTMMSREVKNSIKSLVDSALCNYLNRASQNVDSATVYDPMINYLNLLKYMLRPSGHRNTPFNKHMMMIQVIKFELFINWKLQEGERSVTTDDLKRYRISRPVCRQICAYNAKIRGDFGPTSGIDMRDEMYNKGIPDAMVGRANYILRNLALGTDRAYRLTNISERDILRDGRIIPLTFEYVLEMYDNSVKSAVEDLEIRHSREAEILTTLTTLSPVEEVSLIMANTQTDVLVGPEFNIKDFYHNPTYRDLIQNLMLTHHARWSTLGYTAIESVNGEDWHEPVLNDILRSRALIGMSTIRVGKNDQNPFIDRVVEDEFYLHATTYTNADHAIHNYLFINRLTSGMAVIGKDEERYVLLGIIPKGTVTRNTESTNVPEYVDEYSAPPFIYRLEIANQNLSRVAREIGMRPGLHDELGDMAATVVRQTYQRLVGATATPEDDDHFLVAMAEMAKGAWSQDIGFKILAMMATWLTTENDPSKSDYANVVERLVNIYENPRYRVQIQTSISSTWSWLRLMKITSGPSIDTVRIKKIIKFIGEGKVTGGYSAAVFNLMPKSLNEIKERRGEETVNHALLFTQSMIFKIPDEVETPADISGMLLLLQDRDDEDYDDEL